MKCYFPGCPRDVLVGGAYSAGFSCGGDHRELKKEPSAEAMASAKRVLTRMFHRTFTEIGYAEILDTAWVIDTGWDEKDYARQAKEKSEKTD